MMKNKENSLSYDNNGNLIEKLSYHISTSIGIFFYNLGLRVARNPWKVIAICWLSVLIFSTGFLNFYQEKDPFKLWVPDNIDFHKHTKFIVKNYKEGLKTESVLIISKNNVLTEEVFSKLRKITREINNIKIEGEHGGVKKLNDLCFKVPLITIYSKLMDSMGSNNKHKRSNDDTTEDLGEMINNNPDDFIKKMFDPSFKITTKQYCSIVSKLKLGCMHENILDMWNAETSNLTKHDITEKIDTTYINRVTGHEMNFTTLLGDVERNANGHVISAKSLLTNFNLHLNFSEINLERTGNAAGTESWTTVNVMRFEEKFLILMGKLKREFETEDIKIYYAAGRSYGDISEKTLFQDISKVIFGTFLMTIYMVFILSKYSWVELRLQLTSFGVMNIGMAYISGCGLASTFMFYTPVHSSLFFIILGLGVDDIFVIMAAYRKITSINNIEMCLEEKIARTMQKAGASITITSLTDIIAFLVGSFTILPSLRSFCIFGALCILMTYIYVVTFFVSVLTIDEKRVADKRNGLVPCIKHEEKTPSCEPKLMWNFLHFFHGKIILTKFGKIAVILSVVAITGFSIHRLLLIKQKFDPMWFIPSKTYFYEYVMEHREYYPNRGFEAGVYMNNLNYTADLSKIILMAKEIENQSEILSNVQAWPIKFQDFVLSLYEIDLMTYRLSDAEWKDYLSKFLFSVDGGKFQANFRFTDKLICGQPASDILISSITYTYFRFDDRDEFIPARASIENIVKSLNFSQNDVFVWGRVFANWYTDEIIDSEIYRNISLALIGVFICTTVMIVNIQVCAYIFTCVLLSLVSIGGFMQFWGLTLDIVTSIGLQLSVGLCIDYAAHIGHTFLTISEPDGNKRALLTVEEIGGAVLEGGGSTMLAIMLLATSDAYTFRTFFKIFIIVVIFGLYFGVVFLPVILSIFKPKPYEAYGSHHESNNENELVLLDKDSKNIKIIKQNDKISNSSCDKTEC
ncbi:hypothetical protein ACKWTF_012813 [Chironomus riparius]